MLLIYVPQLSPRIRYTFKIVFTTFLKLKNYQLTTDAVDFINHEGNKISYGEKALGEELFFKSHGLLLQKGIKEQSISISEHLGETVIFPLANSAMPYDPFAATFYFLSRYEEYLPHLRDEHDRFPISQSLAHQYGFYQKAIVDRWLLQLKDLLLEKFPDLEFEARKYHFQLTYDIDNAYAYKQKGMLRTLGGIAKHIYKFELKKLWRQLLVLINKRKDPFDTYNYQLNLQRKYGFRPIYFFLLGDYGLNDKNLSHENRHFQSLIKSIADYAEVGIHPSYGSNKNAEKVKREIKRLERIIKRDIVISRQHFLKLTFPETYRRLFESDIREDYTMGFASDVGFRAGTCTPYNFYDIDEELEFNLKVVPFQVMESSLKYYLKLTPEQASERIHAMIDEVKAVKGTFVSLWHNESLSDEEEWKGWRNVYEQMIEYAYNK